MTETTPAQLRARAESNIQALGSRRRQLQEEIDVVDMQLRPFVLKAREAEVSLRRIQELTGLAPNTIRAWEAKGAEGKDA